MKRILSCICILTLLLSGCHSVSKDEKYNNMSPVDIYQQGVKNVKKKRYPQAIEDFEALESRYPFGTYADKAQLGALYAYYLNEDYTAALPAIDRFIRMHPRHPHIDYVYYMKGLLYYAQAEGFFSKYLPVPREDRDTIPAKKALSTFDVIVKRFPQSVYREDAQRRMIFLRHLLAENELYAAQFYMKKGAYVAVINRAQFVLTHFDETPSVKEALILLETAYRKLNLFDLAEDAHRTLILNYPQFDKKKPIKTKST